jgi:parvulin-like peptidyl-prolyl isomerase
MQQAAANDAGDRIELLNMALANKKLAAMVPDSPPEKGDTDAYWRLQLNIRNMKSQYVVKQYLASLDIPDMSALAEERYKTQKDVYALVPEERYSSHILLLCTPGVCDRDARRIEAEKILAELEAGADFRQLATKYSEDPGSKGKGGQFDKWVKLGEAQVDPYYLGAVYELENVGDHSGIVDTKFGLHIVQLDGVKEAHYKPFDEVKDDIIASLRKDYINLAAKEFDAGFRFTDDTYIDADAVEEILQPYKTVE